MTEVLKDAAEFLTSEVYRNLKPLLNNRKLAEINPYMRGKGLTNFAYDKVSDLSPALAQYVLPDGSEHADMLTLSKGILEVPYIFKRFNIQMGDILAWANRKVAPGETNTLEALSATEAARVVAEKENEIAYIGWNPGGNNAKVDGFLSVAGNSTTGGSIATAGTMFGYVADAIGKLNEDGVYGDNESYNLVLSPAIFSALKTKIRSGAANPEVVEIQNALLGGGSIIMSPCMTGNGGSNKDAALVLPVDGTRQHFEYLNPVAPEIVFSTQEFDGFSPVKGMCVELFAPHFIRQNGTGKCDAVAKITALQV